MEKAAKTGKFSCRSRVLPDLTEEGLDHLRWRMRRELVEPVISAMVDGRVYCVLYGGTEYKIEEDYGDRRVLDFSILLYLMHAREAKVGELVWNLPERVPDEVMEWRAPWGAVFERGGHGWKRVA